MQPLGDRPQLVDDARAVGALSRDLQASRPVRYARVLQCAAYGEGRVGSTETAAHLLIAFGQ